MTTSAPTNVNTSGNTVGMTGGGQSDKSDDDDDDRRKKKKNINDVVEDMVVEEQEQDQEHLEEQKQTKEPQQDQPQDAEEKRAELMSDVADEIPTSSPHSIRTRGTPAKSPVNEEQKWIYVRTLESNPEADPEDSVLARNEVWREYIQVGKTWTGQDLLNDVNKRMEKSNVKFDCLISPTIGIFPKEMKVYPFGRVRNFIIDELRDTYIWELDFGKYPDFYVSTSQVCFVGKFSEFMYISFISDSSTIGFC